MKNWVCDCSTITDVHWSGAVLSHDLTRWQLTKVKRRRWKFLRHRLGLFSKVTVGSVFTGSLNCSVTWQQQQQSQQHVHTKAPLWFHSTSSRRITYLGSLMTFYWYALVGKSTLILGSVWLHVDRHGTQVCKSHFQRNLMCLHLFQWLLIYDQHKEGW